MSYSIYHYLPDVVQVVLPNPGMPVPWGTPTNVYVLLGESPALVGTGHALAKGALVEALASLSLAPEQIGRVVATDWSLSQLGAHSIFTQADLFVGSPDLQQPTDYGAFLAKERETWLRMARELLSREPYRDLMDFEAFCAHVETWFGGASTTLAALDFIPLRSGHTLALAGRTFQVAEAPGFYPGQIVLWEQESGLLFSGRALQERAFGDLHVRQIRSAMRSIEMFFEWEPRASLPTFGRAEPDGMYIVRRSNRRLADLMGNLPFTLQGSLTVPGIVNRDLGYTPRHLLRYLKTVRFYQACMDELVRAGAILKRGQGVWAHYGSDAPDPRVGPV